MGLFDNAGQAAAGEVRAAANEVVQKLDPLLRDVEIRAGAILHGLLDRLDGMTITVHIPQPKAKAANPVPVE